MLLRTVLRRGGGKGGSQRGVLSEEEVCLSSELGLTPGTVCCVCRVCECASHHRCVTCTLPPTAFSAQSPIGRSAQLLAAAMSSRAVGEGCGGLQTTGGLLYC